MLKTILAGTVLTAAILGSATAYAQEFTVPYSAWGHTFDGPAVATPTPVAIAPERAMEVRGVTLQAPVHHAHRHVAR